MNVTYKLTKNRNGQTVVASELAKGHKKNTRIAASALLLTSLASIAGAGVIDLTGYEYTSGTLEQNGANFTIKDSDNGSLDGNGYDGRKTKIINHGGSDSIKFGDAKVKDIVTGGFIKTLNFASMWEDGYVKLYKKDGQNLIPISELPTWPTLNFQKTENFSWVSNNGELRTIRIYSLDNEDMTTGSPGQFEEIILVEQPPVPYYKFNVATALNGTMNLDDTQNKLDWFFGQIKQSNIFSAISNTSAAKIVVGTDDPNESVSMTMTFFPGYMTTDSGTVVSSKQDFGPTKAYAGTFKNAVLATALGLASDDFTVTNIDELRIYQAQITEAISKNLILEGTFDNHFNMAMVSKTADEYLAEVEYDATIDRDDLYLEDVFGKPADKNSILKADGTNATIEIKANAQLKAYYGQIVHGMNSAKITNNATIAIGDGSTYGNMMSNLYLSSKAEYTNKGTLIYGYQPKDATSGGIWDGQQNHFAFVDIVQNATFYNDHEMFVGGYHSQQFNTANKIPLAFNGLGEKSIRSAVNISGSDALFHNRATGVMYVGSMDIVNGTAADNVRSVYSNGVSVNNGAKWINDGLIYVGKKLNANGDVVNSNITYHLFDVLRENDYLLNQTNNAVFANISSAQENLSIINNGEITIGSAMKDLSTDYIQNGAAINIEYQNDTDLTQVEKINVVNKGLINVGGYHSVGMRFYGQIGSDQGPEFLGNDVGGVINVTGSNNVGIMAGKGAIAYNRGVINVGDPDAKGGIISDLFNLRAYGIRAEDATVYIEGADSKINLVGDHSVGVHARVGGKVKLAGNVTMNSTSDAKNNLVYYWISGRKALGNGQFESSEIKFAPGNIILAINDNNSTLFRVDQRAAFDTSDAQGNYEFTVSGEKSRGLYVADQGTTVKADGKDANSKVVFKVEGKDSTGIYVTSSAGKYGTATEGQVLLGENTTIYVAGENASAAVVDGTVFSVNGVALRKDTAILTSKATLTDSTVTFDKGVSGYRLINNGELQHTGKIDFTGQQAVTSGNAVGVYINGGHLNNMNGGEIVVNGIGVDIYGANSIVSNLGSVKAVNGIAAVRLNKDASLTVKGSSATDVIKGEKDADALLVHAGSVLTTSSAQIAVDGKGAGIHFLNMDQDGSGQFKLSGSGTITVKGNDATGILVEGEDANKQPTMGTSDFISDNSSGLVINVEDVGGNGITVNTSGKVHSGASVNIQSKQGQSALVLKGDTTQITQSGNLSSNSETSAVVELKDLTSTQDINFTNLGSIKVSNDATAPAGLVAINANIGKNINLTNGESNTSKGEIVGVVDLGDQKNQVTLFGGSKADVITATSGETSIMLKDVQRGQSSNLFNKLTAGNGAKDSLELSATSNLPNKGSHYALTQAKADEIKGFEQLKIHANSTFELDNSDITLNESAPNGGIHLEDATGTLFVNQSQATGKNTFNHNLYGNGVVKTDINGQEFAFDATKANLIGEKFTGKLQLENAVFNLKNENTTALTKATLSIGQKAQAIVEDGIGKQNIGGLAFDGGRLTFNDNIPNMDTIGQVADGSIHAKNLDFTNAKGTVDIHVDSINNTPTFITDKPILEQDIGESIIQLVSADQVTGVSTGGLKLDIYDANGDLVPQSGATITNDIEQSGKKVANGKYGYGLQSFKDVDSTTADGLYVSYKLTEIELLTKGDDALILHAAAGKTGNGADLAAKVTGAGDLIIATDSDYLSLSNGDNDYTGVTDVRKGNLMLENSDVLGQTSLLNLEADTSVSLFGYVGNKLGVTQAVGAVTAAKNSLINLGNQGELTVKGDANSTIDGNILGGSAAKLIFDKADNLISSQNAGLASRVEVNNDATLQTYHSTSIGSAGDVVIVDDAQLLLGNYDTGNTGFGKALNGKGDVIITESVLNGQKTGSDIEFKADNSNFKGDITIGQTADTLATRLTVTDSLTLGAGDNVTINEQGALNLNFNGASDWKLDKNVTGTGNLEKDGAGTVELTAKAAQYTGTTTVKNGLLVAGTIDDPVTLNSQLLNIEAGGNFLGSGEIKGSVNNSGSFSIGRLDKVETDAAMKYTVNGDFTNQGIINLNVKYPDEDYTSKTNTNAVKHGNIGNELIITGNYIANGGSIYLNTVLNKGKGKGTDETSTDFITVGGDVITQGSATQLFIQNYGGLGAATLPDAIKIVDVTGTSDNGSFILGKPATIGIYEYTLQKGKNDNSWYLSSNPDDPVIDPEKKINPRVGGYLANMAMAFEMFNVTLHDRLGNPDYGQGFLTGDENGISAWGRIVTVHKDYTVVNKRLNISGDYYVAQVGADLIKVAAENDAQYRFGVMAGYGNSDFTSTSRHTSSKADVKIDQAMSVGIYGTWYQPESWFVDTWIQYSHFKNEISMKNSTTSKYNSDLISASIELGYNHRTDDLSNGDHLILQPNAQVIYGHLSTKEYEDMDSGLRVASNKKNNVQTRLGMKVFYIPKDSNFRPYVEGNWIYNSSDMGVNFNDKFTFSSNAPKSRYEVKLGVEGELSKEWSLWGNVSYQFGKDKYKGYKAMLGAKYTW